MKPDSVRALLGLSLVLLLVGATLASPAGALVALTLAGLVVLLPLFRSSRGQRLTGAGVLALSLALGAAQWNAARHDREAWRAHARERQQSAPMPPPVAPPPGSLAVPSTDPAYFPDTPVPAAPSNLPVPSARPSAPAASGGGSPP